MIGLKVCGIRRPQDLRACVELGVDAVGFNFWARSRRFVRSEDRAALVRERESQKKMPLAVGVFVNPTLPEIEGAHADLALDQIQLHSDAPAPPGLGAWLDRKGLGWVRVIRGTPELDQIKASDPQLPPPSWTLLDALVPGFGGEGARTDWAWAAKAVTQLAPHPVWLAGGIHPGNVRQALGEVRPAGIDVASGSEASGATGGEKDRTAIVALLAACRAPS